MSKVVELNVKKADKPTKEERKQIFCEVIDRLMDYNISDVSKLSGVSYTTLYNWIHGNTISPLLRTVIDVAEVIDLEFVLVETQTAKRKKVASL